MTPSPSFCISSLMGGTDDNGRPSAREIFDSSLSGARNRPFIPQLRSDEADFHPVPQSLREYRQQEGVDQRRKRLRALWSRLPKKLPINDFDDEAVSKAHPVKRDGDLTQESAKELDEMYENELYGRCGGHTKGFSRRISWPDFLKYADAKEQGMSSSQQQSCRVS